MLYLLHQYQQQKLSYFKTVNELCSTAKDQQRILINPKFVQLAAGREYVFRFLSWRAFLAAATPPPLVVDGGRLYAIGMYEVKREGPFPDGAKYFASTAAAVRASVFHFTLFFLFF